MTEIIKALELLRSGKWVDLTHEVHNKIPKYGAFPDLETKTPYTLEKDGFFVHEVSFITQYGTHIDAPVHFSKGKRSLEELELKEFILPLYVINKEKEVEKNNDFILSVKDILEFEEEHGKIEPESFVAFASGWSKRWEGNFYNKDEKDVSHTPGWSIEALDLLLNQRGVLGVGHETMDTDASKDVLEKGFLYAEKFVLDANKFQVELLKNLTELPAKGGVIFIGVPKFKGFPGFPVRCFAIV
ncbi:cyclase family protein [Campylobacter jejuni]|uniref:cyclase family protein n=1 Tax=Campylobacter jejuni TaxID=197 RepID=UPI000F809A6A|nr:cyclase family protein [Campylobacter jejuni]RTJ58111.1 cyclase [Campylobacter jejuni]